jgi:hypothetical protein
MTFTEWLELNPAPKSKYERNMRAKRRDANHKTVGDYLRAQGWSVLDLADHGDGVPDYAVSKPLFAALVEVKDPAQPPSKRELTPKEQKVRDDWQGPYIIALTGEQAHEDLCIAYIEARR